MGELLNGADLAAGAWGAVGEADGLEVVQDAGLVPGASVHIADQAAWANLSLHHLELTSVCGWGD
ncbi:hypothetical protein [Streptomyces sp. NPDC029004]|uniref:hypothetical protein n=1 Tax=Streptomyces sp. NPDC029004 TaxID=3154490 RepID=UPI0033E606C2